MVSTSELIQITKMEYEELLHNLNSLQQWKQEHLKQFGALNDKFVESCRKEEELRGQVKNLSEQLSSSINQSIKLREQREIKFQGFQDGVEHLARSIVSEVIAAFTVSEERVVR